jgi:glucose uptake protein GlcU
MHRYKTDIRIIIGLLVFALIIFLVTSGQSTIDVQLHDTYFVVDNLSLAALLIGPLMFLIFLARALATRFENKLVNIALAIGLILVAVITYQAIQFQRTYLSEIMKLNNVPSPNKEEILSDIKNTLKWTWTILALWGLGLVLLIFKTLGMWKASRG